MYIIIYNNLTWPNLSQKLVLIERDLQFMEASKGGGGGFKPRITSFLLNLGPPPYPPQLLRLPKSYLGDLKDYYFGLTWSWLC